MAMGDPTISEGSFPNLIKDIEEKIDAGQNNDQIVDEINQSILDARLKSASNPSSHIMTLNMNGLSSGKGTAKKRKAFLKVIMSCAFPAAVFFCQELPGKFKQEVVPEGWEFFKNGTEAAVIWKTEHFDGSAEGLRTTDKEIREIRDKVTDASGLDLLSRMALVKLTRRQEPKESLLAVSWYRPYKKGDGERERVFQTLHEFVKDVMERKGIPSYIIGGDFNFDTFKIVSLPKDVAVPSYSLSPRSQKKDDESNNYIPHKDNLIAYPYTNLRVSWIRAVQFEDNETAGSDLTKFNQEKVQKAMQEGARASSTTLILDHDPIVAVLEYLPRHSKSNKTVRGLTKEFDQVSLSDKPKEQ